MSEITPVHPEYHKEGVRFQLFSDGTVMARTRDLPAREVLRLTNKDTGRRGYLVTKTSTLCVASQYEKVMLTT